jgi:anti-sigma regulatory factor (Ser/Thr protein kinase)
MLIEDPLKILTIEAAHGKKPPLFGDGILECITFNRPDISSAIEELSKNKDVDAVVIDASEPVENDRRFLHFLNAQEDFKMLPLIVQGQEPQQQYLEALLKHPTVYYLPNELSAQAVGALVGNAAQAARRNKRLQRDAARAHQALMCIKQANFSFNHINQARDLAYFISQCYPEPERVVIGLAELMMNAVEHGILGISYEEKRDLIMANCFYEEMETRLKQKIYAEQVAHVQLECMDDEIRILIADPGEGFNWRKFLDIDPNRMADPNGRGIAMARQFSFDLLEYNETGNMVMGVVRL